MFVAGVDAHTTYVMIAIVDTSGNSVHGPARIPNTEADRLVRLLEEHTPVEVVVETCPSWPWLFDLLERPGIHLGTSASPLVPLGARPQCRQEGTAQPFTAQLSEGRHRHAVCSR